MERELCIHNLTNHPLRLHVCRPHKWQKPPVGITKINVDAVMGINKQGMGVVGHDSDGFVIGGCLHFKSETMGVEWAELDAIQTGLTWAIDKILLHISLESDYVRLVNRINSCHDYITLIGYRVLEI